MLVVLIFLSQLKVKTEAINKTMFGIINCKENQICNQNLPYQ